MRKSQIIKKVEIEHYRSLGKVSFGLEDLNIFSGLNNSGKSNILRALNLFFNGESRFGEPYSHELDYSKAYGGHAGNKREIKITLHFHPVGESSLSKPFSVTKRFSIDVTSPVPEFCSDDPETQKKLQNSDGNVMRQFSGFLSSIRYFYIPAVRDKVFAQRIFRHFEQALAASSQSKINDSLQAISNSLNDISKEVSDDFETFMGLTTQAAVASNLLDILGTVSVRVKTPITLTKHGGKEDAVFVDLFSSGDGVLMSYLPHFLDYLAKKMKRKHIIWGFEEPENSLEYSKIQKLADMFAGEFNKRAQILITTHSPAFINMKEGGDHVLFYRVYQDSAPNRKPLSAIKTVDALRSLQQGLFDDGSPLSGEYEKLSRELFLVEQSSEIEEYVRRIQESAEGHRVAKEEFIESHRLLRPANIFVCEDGDSRAKEVWRHLLGVWGIDNVEVFSSEGAATDLVENWLRVIQREDPAYKPRIFRTIDSDGLTLKMREAICGERRKNKKQSPYQFRVFPLYEIENVSVLLDPESFDNDFWLEKQRKVVESFEVTAEAVCKKWSKHFDNEQEKLLFMKHGGTFVPIVQEMKAAAEVEWRAHMPGKEMCKEIRNYEPYQKILSVTKKAMPKEVAAFLCEVKNFFSGVDFE